MSEFGVVLLHNTSSVMRSEKILSKGNISVKLIPTPREFSSDCGMAVRFVWADVERVRALLEQARVEVAGIHQMPS